MIGHKIKKLRKQKGLTQSQLGKGMLSVSYISQIENNQREIPDDLIEEFARRLGVSPDLLYAYDQNENIHAFKDKITEALEHLYNFHVQECKELLDDLRDKLKHYILDEDVVIKYILAEAFYYLHIEDITKAEENLSKIMDYSIQEYPVLHFRYLLLKGYLTASKKQFRDSIFIFEEALKLSADPSEMDLALLYYRMGLSYYNLSDFQHSYDYFLRAIPIFTKLGYWYYLAYSYNHLGNIYLTRSNWEMALEHYHKVWKLARDLNSKILLAPVLHNLGLVYFELGKKDKAYQYWQESLDVAKCHIEKAEIIPIYNIFYAYYKQEKWDDFLETYEILKEVLKNQYNPPVEARMYRTLGHYYKNVVKDEVYLSYYQSALDLFMKAELYMEAGDMAYTLAKETKNMELYKESATLYKKYLDQLKIKHD